MELRPRISKTHVYFTRNQIHLVLVYLHLTHQMQFCKSHSIAKRHFCLSCPSEGSREGEGAPEPDGKAWWRRRRSLIPPMSLRFGSRPQDTGAHARPNTQWILGRHRDMGGVHSKHRVSVSNGECSWETQSKRNRIKESFSVINNCKLELLIQKDNKQSTINKNQQPHLGPSSRPW